MDNVQDFLDRYNVIGILGTIAIAIVILVVTWIIAKVVAAAFAKLTTKVPALRRAGADGESLGKSLGTIAALLVWLFGLVALLDLFGLTQVLAPIQGLLAGIFEFLPNLIGAVFVFVVGALLAKIIRQLVETALGAVPFDQWVSKAKSGAGRATGTHQAGTATGTATAPTATTPGMGAQIGKMVGLVLYSLIMIVVAIAALQILGIESISGPAQSMLNMIFEAIPNIIAAGLLLAIGVLIARFAGDLLQQLLDGLGTDRALHEMEVLPADRSATPAITKIVQIAIVLFFAVMAAQMLGFPQITRFLSEILELGGQVVFGGAIIAAGFIIATQLAKLVSGNGGQVVKWATLVLFTAMGLKFMGIADSIIELGFGALVIGAAAAAALAFGLGGRDAAARQLERLQARQGSSTSSQGGSPSDTI